MSFKKKSISVKKSITGIILLLCFIAFISVSDAADIEIFDHPLRNDPPAVVLEMNQLKSVFSISGDGSVLSPQTVYLDVNRDDTKMQMNANVSDTSTITLELISPKGVTERSYTFNKSGFLQGNQEYINGSEKIMVSNIAERGIWTLRISSTETLTEKTEISAMLIEPNTYSFIDDVNDKEPDGSEGQNNNSNTKITDQIYDYYKTYEEARLDIENGYIFNMNQSFSTAAMPCVNNNTSKSFFVYENNTLDIEIRLKNLIDGTGRDPWTPDSFVQFEIIDPKGKTAYPFYKQGEDIESLTEIATEIALYPGEWNSSGFHTSQDRNRTAVI